jgi:HK97 family phage prohead protease
MKPEKYSHIDFKPPSGARREAEYGLKLRREYGRGGTAVGIARARDLSNGEELSPSTLRRMKAYFDRHEIDKQGEGFNRGDKGWPSNGYIAAKLWGGFESGYSWAKKVVEQMNAADEKEDSRSLRPYGSTHGMKPKVVVVHGPPASGKSTYVAMHKGDNDVVFDFDHVMSAISGNQMYAKNDNLVSYCTDIRTLILKRALQGSKVDKTWVVTTRVPEELKQQLSDVPVSYVHVDTPKDECLRRLSQDSHMKNHEEELRTVIEDYFSETGETEKRFAPSAPNVERRFLGNFGDSQRPDPELLRVERRADPSTGKQRTYVVGYAARFHRDSLLLGDFVERIDPEAFKIVETRTDSEGQPLQTRCLFNHDPNFLLGRFPTTMTLSVDEKGLKYTVLLPESRQDIAESVERGDLRGSSFSFVVAEGGEEWTTENGRSIRLVKKIKSLLDCGPVTYPAYGDSTVAVAKRSYEAYCSSREDRSSQPAARIKKPRANRPDIKQLREFLAERRSDCGRGSDGKFGSGNKCQDEGDGGGEKELPSTPMNKSSGEAGEKSKALGGMIDRIAKEGKGKTGEEKYVAKPPKKTDLLAREVDDDKPDWLGRKPRKTEDVPTKIPDSKKKDTGGYMEWGKGKDAEAQDFIDSARKGQLERGGKSEGKTDDGSGVQTWSKGDSYPWTTKQVGDSTKGGYVQGMHPDGSKTEKYKFPAGSDGSESHKQAESEIKKKTIRSLRAFLEARR